MLKYLQDAGIMKMMKINNIELDKLIDELKQQGLSNEQIYYRINEMLERENEE